MEIIIDNDIIWLQYIITFVVVKLYIHLNQYHFNTRFVYCKTLILFIIKLLIIKCLLHMKLYAIEIVTMIFKVPHDGKHNINIVQMLVKVWVSQRHNIMVHINIFLLRKLVV